MLVPVGSIVPIRAFEFTNLPGGRLKIASTGVTDPLPPDPTLPGLTGTPSLFTWVFTGSAANQIAPAKSTLSIVLRSFSNKLHVARNGTNNNDMIRKKLKRVILRTFNMVHLFVFTFDLIRFSPDIRSFVVRLTSVMPLFCFLKVHNFDFSKVSFRL